jgi:hypothetical protein
MTTAANKPTPGVVRSMIPARLHQLPWSPFHTRMVVALGVAWILEGLEITVTSAVADTLTQPETSVCPRRRSGWAAVAPDLRRLFSTIPTRGLVMSTQHDDTPRANTTSCGSWARPQDRPTVTSAQARLIRTSLSPAFRRCPTTMIHPDRLPAVASAGCSTPTLRTWVILA